MYLINKRLLLSVFACAVWALGYGYSLPGADRNVSRDSDDTAKHASELYLVAAPVEQMHLRLLGKLMAGDHHPVHCKLQWVMRDPVTGERSAWQTELAPSAGKPEAQTVGIGDGYVVLKQRINLGEIRGTMLGTCDPDEIAHWISAYAGTQNGNLAGSQMAAQRDWYPEPQGYGGPTYERATSNTYVAWLLKKLGFYQVTKPEGAIGWNVVPKFPGPKK